MHIKAAILTALLLTSPALAGTTPPDYDFQWSTISDPGNPGYFGIGDGPLGRIGRGDVDYEYRMSRLEVTTAQWIEFVNTFSTQSEELADRFEFFLSRGERRDPNYEGPGERYILNDAPNAGQLPVGGISFRNAAYYCNWLHHGKPSDWAVIQDGAYDASTFGVGEDGGLTDQVVRSPGARFWIPSLSEWKKAVHWDPNKDGPGEGGWWLNQYGSDTDPIPGLPGEPGVQTSAGLPAPPPDPYTIPLGAYPNAQSPWGLFDTSGGLSEMLEGWWESEPPFRSMPYAGQLAGPIGFGENAHHVVGLGTGIGGDDARGFIGLRIASNVPSPGTASVLCGGTTLFGFRRKRTCKYHDISQSPLPRRRSLVQSMRSKPGP